MIRAISGLAAACLVLAPFAKAQGPARIYVYVQTETPARSWFPVWCDNTAVAKVKRGRFFAVNVSPGRHMLSGEKGVPVFVEVPSGGEAFVHLDWTYGDMGGPAIPVWRLASPTEAEPALMYLMYIDTDKILSKSVSKEDPRSPPQLKRRNHDES